MTSAPTAERISRLTVFSSPPYFIAVENSSIFIDIQHLRGSSNDIADAISRNQLDCFSRLMPGADRDLTTLPLEIFTWSVAASLILLDRRRRAESTKHGYATGCTKCQDFCRRPQRISCAHLATLVSYPPIKTYVAGARFERVKRLLRPISRFSLSPTCPP